MQRRKPGDMARSSLLSAIVVPVITAALVAGSPVTSPQSAALQLFNGRDLSGWTPKITGYASGVNFGNTFRVEDGVLEVRYDAYDKFNDRFGHLFYKDSFSFYRLTIEYRFVGEQSPGGPGWALRNSGVMLHGEPPDAMRLEQEFPTSIEVQFLGGDGRAERPTSNVCTPGTHVVIDGKLVTRHCTNSTSKTHHGDAWVTAGIEVCGNRSIRHLLDGQVVMAYAAPQLDDRDSHARLIIERSGTSMLSGGTISLQSESHPVDFRRVELTPLEDASCGGSTSPATPPSDLLPRPQSQRTPR